MLSLVQNCRNLRYEMNMLFHIQLKKKPERALVQATRNSLYLAHPVNFYDDRWVAYRFAAEGCIVPSAILQGCMNLVQSQCTSFPNESFPVSHGK